MSIQHIKKRISQLAARMEYYGLDYLMDYILVSYGKREFMHSVKRKEAAYASLEGQAYIDELARWYHASTGDVIDFNHPVTFNQKLQWCKVYDRNPLKTKLADKYMVREWVSEKIGRQYLVPLIGVWDRFDDIDFSTFPAKFVLKCNHGSGWNIVVDKEHPFDKAKAKKNIDQWMSENFAYKAGFELHYKDIKPKILAEEYLENNGGDLYDYKFYCFDGKVEYIHFLMDRKLGLRMAYFDRSWVKQPFSHNHPRIEEKVPKPNNLDLMIQMAETLGAGFPYVRVDFYSLNDGTIKFGELTFTPASGTQDWNSPETAYLLGKKFHLPEKYKGEV